MTEKTCKNCDSCKRLYARIWYSYYREKVFYCNLRKEIIQKSDVCAHWQKISPVYDLSAERFEQAIDDVITILEQIKDT